MTRVSGEVRDSYISLSAEFAFEARQLMIQYRITPLTHEKIAVFDGLMRFAEDGNLKWDPFMAYVSFEPEDTVAIKRIIPPLPELKDVEFRHVPLAHVVQAQVHQGEIHLSVPIEEYNPYYPPYTESIYSEAIARHVALILGYKVVNEKVRLIKAHGLPDLYQVWGVEPLYQIRLEVAAPEPGIPVRYRIDEPYERV
jgi:hypothetical protein